jgi:hypothetical protein
LEIPLELPDMTVRLKLPDLTLLETFCIQLLHRVRIRLPSQECFDLGSKIPITVEIDTLAHWNKPKDQILSEDVQLMYDIATDSEDWLLSGLKRKEYQIKVCRLNDEYFLITFDDFFLRR